MQSNPIGGTEATYESGEALTVAQILARVKASKGTLPLIETPQWPRIESARLPPAARTTAMPSLKDRIKGELRRF
jgi:hypothetical protein